MKYIRMYHVCTQASTFISEAPTRISVQMYVCIRVDTCNMLKLWVKLVFKKNIGYILKYLDNAKGLIIWFQDVDFPTNQLAESWIRINQVTDAI